MRKETGEMISMRQGLFIEVFRNSDVVDAAASVLWLMECGEQGSSN